MAGGAGSPIDARLAALDLDINIAVLYNSSAVPDMSQALRCLPRARSSIHSTMLVRQSGGIMGRAKTLSCAAVPWYGSGRVPSRTASVISSSWT